MRPTWLHTATPAQPLCVQACMQQYYSLCPPSPHAGRQAAVLQPLPTVAPCVQARRTAAPAATAPGATSTAPRASRASYRGGGGWVGVGHTLGEGRHGRQ